MNTGIADAINLSWKIAGVLAGDADPKILDTYEPERIAFARALAHTTDRLFRFVNGPGRRHRLVRAVLFRGLLPAVLRTRRGRTAVYGKISQTKVNYRRSALSSGGDPSSVRGGDRLHFVTLHGGADNFQPLTSFDWQLHVHGTPPAGLAEIADRHTIPLHRFRWTASMGDAGLRQDRTYLIRPDGYVGLAAADQHIAQLGAYLAAFNIHGRPPTPKPTP